MKSDLEKAVSETTPLLPHRSKAAIMAEYSACFIVALPTAFLSGLAMLPGDLNNLHSPDDLNTMLARASSEEMAYGMIAFSASEAVLFFLNKRYLLASSKAGLELLKRTVLTLKSIICCHDLKDEDHASLAENGLFYWSFLTSLIFAAIGAKSLAFLGIAGEITGFSLSLLVYFSTRFAGAKIFFRDISDVNWRTKQKYLAKLSIIADDTPAIGTQWISSAISRDEALQRFLKELDEKWDYLPKNLSRSIANWISWLSGYTLAIVCALPIMASFIPEAVAGTETLTQTNIGESAAYQNPASFALGSFTTLLTLFFYEVNIEDLPRHLLETIITVYEKFQAGDIPLAVKLLALTLIAAGASCCTGLGFRLIASMALRNGYLSYLGSWLSNLIPDGLLIAVTAMLWSNLQELITNTAAFKTPVDPRNICEINISNARALLESPDTKIVATAISQVGLLKHKKPKPAPSSYIIRYEFVPVTKP